jgi:hypothetical protein
LKLVVAAALAFTGVSAAAVGREQLPATELRAFKPEADAYVTAAAPARNFGSVGVLRVKRSPQATVYLRFRIRKVKSDDITSVTLLLHALAGPRRSYQVRPVSRDDWREQRLTYENAPALSLRYAASKPVRRGAWSAVDVTPFITDDGGRVNLAITTRSELGVVFASRESEHGPRLVVRATAREGEMEGQAP